MSDIQLPTLPPFVAERLEDLSRKVRRRPIVWFVWSKLLTEEQRAQVASSDVIGPDIVDIWEKLHGLSNEEALIEIARKSNFLWPDEDQRLLDYLRTSTRVAHRNCGTAKPVFADGQLCFEGRVIRFVQRRATKTRPEILLSAFQDAGWPPEIRNPFGTNEPQAIHSAIRWTNTNLRTIRFVVWRGGQSIAWVKRQTSCEVAAN